MPTVVDDRYELLEVLASGGMATVWRARDTRLGRAVALKRPHPAPAGSEAPERIAREARAAAGVSHPNLVTMFDAGTDDGGPYLVMELLGGSTLAAPGRLIGPLEAVSIGAQIGDALAAVHEAGIVHRDVKPSNVILSERGPCLTDFGIASIEEATRDLTQPGTIMATPSYAAPEVLAGETPNSASDVFSLSALVYELLTGQAPYRGTDRTSPLSHVDDPAIDAVLRSGLASDPSERPSASDFAARLRAAAPTQAMTAAKTTLRMPVFPPQLPDEGTTNTEVTTAIAAANQTVPQQTPPARVGAPPVTSGASRPPWLGGIVLVALALVALIAWATRSPGDPRDDLSPTTVTPSASTSPPTTGATSTVAVDPIVIARNRLGAVLASIRPPELKPKDRAEILEKIDEAIAQANGDQGEAEQKLGEAADSIRRELGDTQELEATAALVDLARALELEFNPVNEGGDD